MISYILPWVWSSKEPAGPQPPPHSSLAALLSQYETPGIAPPSARVGPQMFQRENPPLGIRDAWRVGAFVAVKGTFSQAQTLDLLIRAF